MHPARPARRLFGLAGLLVAVVGAKAAVESAAPNPRYTGTLVVQEWTPEETGGKPQSFSILQDPATGLIYAGNEAGVLEYDGVRWRRLPQPPGAPADGLIARGLELDAEGRIWAAAENDVLIYTADEAGQWQALSPAAGRLRADLSRRRRSGVARFWTTRR